MAAESVVVVFDENISPRVCGAVAGFCGELDRFQFKTMKAGTKDPEWLLGHFPEQPPHIIITRDGILRLRAQTQFWLAGKLTVVILDHRLGNSSLEDLAAILLRWWPVIASTILSSPTGAAFVVPFRFTKRQRLPKWVPPKKKLRKRGGRSLTKAKRDEKARKADRRQGVLNLGGSTLIADSIVAHPRSQKHIPSRVDADEA